jgi:hypothetical protein
LVGSCGISQCDHRLSYVEDWAERASQTLRRLMGEPVSARDFTDDRLGGGSRLLSNDAYWLWFLFLILHYFAFPKPSTYGRVAPALWRQCCERADSHLLSGSGRLQWQLRQYPAARSPAPETTAELRLHRCFTLPRFLLQLLDSLLGLRGRGR